MKISSFNIQNEIYHYFMKKYRIDLLKVYPYFFGGNQLNKNYVPNNLNKSELSGKIIDKSLSYISDSEFGENGIFFTTNMETIKLLIKNIDISPATSKKVLEPSCGVGNIIVALINKTINNLKDQYSSLQILNTICSSITGVEINMCFCIATEALMLLACEDLIRDILADNPSYIMPKFQIINADFITTFLFENNHFDYIVGNPPYVTLYGRRSKNMTETKRDFYNNNFDFVVNKKNNNKFNYSMFFLEKAIKYAKPNGEISYLLDISFFESPYKNIRKYILENAKVKMVNLLSGNDFTVASNQLLLTFEKNLDFSTNQSNIVIWNENNITYSQNQYNYYNEKNEYKYFKPLSSREEILINSMEFENPTLGDMLPNKELRTCCALTGKTEEFISDSEEAIPYLEGSKGVSEKYCVPKSDKRIKLDYELQIRLSNQFKKELEVLGVKNKKRVTLGDTDLYYSPKLFIRQSATEIITTYTEEPFAANNSLYIISYKSDDLNKKKLLKYLMAVLNSSIITKYAITKKIIRVGVGKTPQIKLSDLKKIPIVYSDELIQTIVPIVDQILIETDMEKKKSNIKRVDSIIEAAYLCN